MVALTAVLDSYMHILLFVINFININAAVYCAAGGGYVGVFLRRADCLVLRCCEGGAP